MQAVPFTRLIDAVRGESIGVPAGGEFERVEIDSRNVRPGDLFWALAGTKADGHQFVADAFQRGAAAAVVSRPWIANHERPAGACVAVDDTFAALHAYATRCRAESDALVIGITGSVGKTTTKHLLHCVLASRFAGMASPGNYNNHVGVPLSLSAIERDHEFAILELAASQGGEIGALARLVQPEIGVLTAIAPAHLEGFGTIEEICRAKGELLEELPDGGFAVLNGDDQNVRRLAQRARCRAILVGERITNDVVAREVEVDDGWIRFRVGTSDFELPAVGRHHLPAALIGIAIGREVGLQEDEIAAGLRQFRPVPGRCEPFAIGEWTVIDDTYNANPGSMQAACRALREWRHANRRILVLGDMLELGPRTEEFHRQLGATEVVCGADRLVAVGSQAATIAMTARETGMDAGCLGACRDIDTALMLLDCWLEPGDVILVKGSRGMKMERIVAGLRVLLAERVAQSQARRAA